VMYGQASTWPARLNSIFGQLADASRNKFYLDGIYSACIVWPIRAVAQMCRFVDWLLIDTILVDGVGSLPGKVFGKTARPMQNGLVQFYALSMTLALAVLLWALLLRQVPNEFTR